MSKLFEDGGSGRECRRKGAGPEARPSAVVSHDQAVHGLTRSIPAVDRASKRCTDSAPPASASPTRTKTLSLKCRRMPWRCPHRSRCDLVSSQVSTPNGSPRHHTLSIVAWNPCLDDEDENRERALSNSIVAVPGMPLGAIDRARSRSEMPSTGSDADEAQRRNIATVESWTTHKVNPHCGCLPTLFRFPVCWVPFTSPQTTLGVHRTAFLRSKRAESLETLSRPSRSRTSMSTSGRSAFTDTIAVSQKSTSMGSQCSTHMHL